MVRGEAGGRDEQQDHGAAELVGENRGDVARGARPQLVAAETTQPVVRLRFVQPAPGIGFEPVEQFAPQVASLDFLVSIGGMPVATDHLRFEDWLDIPGEAPAVHGHL